MTSEIRGRAQLPSPGRLEANDGVRVLWFVGSLFASIGKDLGLNDFDTLEPEIDRAVLYPPPSRASTLSRVPRPITAAFAAPDAEQRKALYEKVFRGGEELAAAQWEALHILASKAVASGKDVGIYESLPINPRGDV